MSIHGRMTPTTRKAIMPEQNEVHQKEEETLNHVVLELLKTLSPWLWNKVTICLKKKKKNAEPITSPFRDGNVTAACTLRLTRACCKHD